MAAAQPIGGSAADLGSKGSGDGPGPRGIGFARGNATLRRPRDRTVFGYQFERRLGLASYIGLASCLAFASRLGLASLGRLGIVSGKWAAWFGHSSSG